MKRSGFKRKEPAPGEAQRFSTFTKPRKAMAQRSEKRKRAYAGDDENEGRVKLRARLLEEREACEVCVRIVTLVRVRCNYTPVDVHEILARSAGGSIVDEANMLVACRWGHDWIGNHPNEATRLGIRRSRYNRPEGKT